MAKINILITSCGCQPAIEAIRALKQARLHTEFKQLIIYGMDMNPLCYGTKIVDSYIQTINSYGESYIHELKDKVKELNIDGVILSDTTEMYWLRKTQMWNEIPVILPSTIESIVMYTDKWECYNRLLLGQELFKYINIPRTILYVNNCIGITEKYILKKRTGAGSLGTAILDSLTNTNIFDPKYKEHIAQQFIEGTEYTCDFLNIPPKPLIIAPRKRLHVKNGQVFIAELQENPEVIKAVTEVVQAYNLIWGNIQVIQKDDGSVWFIEWNGKFGSGVPLSINAGFNQPELVLRKHFNFNIPEIKIEWNLIMSRALTNMFFQSDNYNKTPSCSG